MAKPLRITFVSPTLYPVLVNADDVKMAGGAEVQQLMIIRLLQSMGHEIGVVTGDFGQPERVVHQGITIDRMPAPKSAGIPGLRFIHPRLTGCVAALGRQRPDVIYHRVCGAYLAACAYYRRRQRIKLMFASASDVDFAAEGKPGVTRRDLWLFRWGLKRSDAILTQNLAQQRLLQQVWGRSGFIVPNCSDGPVAPLASFAGPVLFVGTVKHIKRPDLFLELARAMPERQFKLVGGLGPGVKAGSYNERITAECKSIKNLEVLGFVPYAKVHEQFAGASLLVNTSPVEGFPNTFLQAWARGIPTLSFVGPEVEAGVSGTLAVSDLPAMINRARALLNDPVQWAAQSAHCLDHFSRFHRPEAVAARYAGVLSGFLQDGAA